MEQKIICVKKNYGKIYNFLKEKGVKKIFLVCGEYVKNLEIGKYFINLKNIKVTMFSKFKPNPVYESVVEGVKLFSQDHYDMIIAIGGGSCIDVAKCIKLFSNMKDENNYLKEKIVPNDIELVAVPTTAGTGSEATQYAVIYYNGEKQSISDLSIIPQTVIFDTSTLYSLSEYQRCSTMLDALSHAIESMWSINSNDKSMKYSEKSLKLILEYKDSYLKHEEKGNEMMLRASNIAGKAINITQTTGAHAMSYKLTSLYGISHGHAVALCITKLYPYMINNIDKCIDSRGKDYLKKIFQKMAIIFGGRSYIDGSIKLQEIVDGLKLSIPKVQEKDYETLRKSVNITRLKNNPVYLDEETIDLLYHEILRERK